MPQVKELKELGVAGSATNEQGRYGSGMARFVKSLSCLPIFCTPVTLPVTGEKLLQERTVTGYEQELLHVTRKDC